jgi:hypothetical protein
MDVRDMNLDLHTIKNLQRISPRSWRPFSGSDNCPKRFRRLCTGWRPPARRKQGERRGAGFLAIWSDVEAHDLTDYRHWLTREHTTERVTTRGFLASRFFRAVRDDINHFFILYELEAREVLDGEAYLARLNVPTSWSQRIMPKLRNFMRGGGIMACEGLVTTIGRDEEVIRAYIRNQELADQQLIS